jgi:hypothetical protein
MQTGDVLIAGGFFDNFSSATNRSVIVNRGSGKVTDTAAPMLSAVGQHTATMLRNGKILIAGGRNQSTISAALQIFDPSNGLYSSAGSLATARYGHTATLLNDGRVLIVGGSGVGVPALASYEIIDPVKTTTPFYGAIDSGRIGHTATRLPDGKVLIAGGFDGSSYLNTTVIIDPVAGTYTPAPAMTFARGLHTATLLADGTLLIAGGKNGTILPGGHELRDPVSGVFTAYSSSFTTRIAHSATLLPNGKVLIVGGADAAMGAQQPALTYDPDPGVNNFTAETANLATNRYNHNAVLLPNGTVLITGGQTDSISNPPLTVTKSAEIYNYQVNIFDPASSPLVSARGEHRANIIPSTPPTVLLTGGKNTANALNSAELYDITSRTFASIPMLSSHQSHATALLPGGRVAIFGGYSSTSKTSATNKALIYAPGFGFSAVMDVMTSARGQHTATPLKNGKVLIVGGNKGYSTGDDVLQAELFDPSTGTFTTTATSLNAAHSRHTATPLKNGKVLIAGGTDYLGSSKKTAELYDPVTQTFALAAPTQGGMTVPRAGHTATLLQDGRVLIAGGELDGTVEIYDPGGDVFIPIVAPWNILRTDHTATLLPSGMVMFAGGLDLSGYPQNTISLYDPATGALWNNVSPMSSCRSSHSASLLPDGRVLISGGYGKLFAGDCGPAGGADNYLATAEIFSPGLQIAAANPLRSKIPQLTAFDPVANILSGTNFTGDSEGSSGTSNSSPSDYPVVTLQGIQGDFLSYLTPPPGPTNVDFWTPTSFQAAPATVPPGYYYLALFANGLPSPPLLVNYSPSIVLTPASYNFGTVPYGGSATWPITISNPGSSPLTVSSIAMSGADYSVDPNGGTTPCASTTPVVPPGGSCTVSVTIAPTSIGTLSGTLSVASDALTSPDTATFTASAIPATATVTIDSASLSQVYDRTAKTVLVLTNPPELPVDVTYNGSFTRPINAGSYSVVATVIGPNYTGSASGTLTVAKAPLTVAGMTAASRPYDGTTTATLSGGTLVGIVSPDSVSINTSTGSFADRNIGTAKQVTVSAITLTGADVGNYTVTKPIGITADITPLIIAPVVAVSNKAYDGTTAATITVRALTGVLPADAATVTLSGGSASFADISVGTAKPVTATGLTLSGASAGNYLLSTTSASTTAAITPLAVTPVVTVSNKAYDGTTAATIVSRTLTGVLPADSATVVLTGGSALFADANAGTAKTVTTTGLTITGPNAGNYTLSTTSATTTADITPLAVTPGVTANDKVYDGTSAATIAGRTLTGVLPADSATVALTGGSALFADANIGTAKKVTVSGLTLTGSAAGNYALTATSATTTASITPLAVTPAVTVSNKSYDGTTAATIVNRTATGVLTADAATAVLTGGSALFADANSGTAKPVSVTSLTLSGPAAGNYTLSAATTTATADITPLTITPVITAGNKPYDGTTAASITSRTLTGVLPADAATVALTGGSALFVDANAGTAKTVTATGLTITGSGAGNYTLSTASAATTADISQLTVTPGVTANNKVYDGTTAATIASRTLTGVLPADSATVLLTGGSALFADANAGTAKTVTATGLTITGPAAGNYALSTSSAVTTADITQAVAAVVPGNLVQTYDGRPKSVTTTTTPAGLTVAITYNGAPDAPVIAGTYPVTATVVDANYSGSASATLVIAKATPVITWPVPAAINSGIPISAMQLNAIAPVPGTFAYTPSTGTLPTTTTVNLGVTFTPNDTANYTTATDSVPLTVVSIPPDITITGATPHPTGQTSAAFNFTSTEATATFQCSLDGAPFSACSSPQTYTGLAGGVHTFAVQAVNLLGSPSTAAATYTLLADLLPPTDGSLLATPGNGQVTLTWSGFADPDSGIAAYRMVSSSGELPADCSGGTTITSPYILPNLTNDVAYTYRVCAVDNVGNVSLGAVASATPKRTFITMTPVTAAYTYQITGSTSAPQTFTISNTGAAAIGIQTLAFTAANSADFIRTGGSCGTAPFSLAAGASCTVDAAFAPGSGSGTSRSALLALTSNEPDPPIISAALTGQVRADGILSPNNSSGIPGLADALILLRIAMDGFGPNDNRELLLLHGDLAPLVNGIPAPDGILDIGDALVLLRRVAGLLTW